MSDLRKSFKERIIVPYNKYNGTQYKLGEILESDKKTKKCTVLYKTNKGVLVESQDVPLKNSTIEGFSGKFPKKGDKVEIEETNNTIRIIGIVNKDDIKAYESTSDIYSGEASYSGYIGI